MNRKPVGLYIHVPFCRAKCPYCDFYSIPHTPDRERAYIDKVIQDMDSFRGKAIPADTLYFGGGTPSLLDPLSVERIIDAAKEIFSLEGEITLEANPESVTREKLIRYCKAGINRMSFGVQAAREQELHILGRLHSFSEAQRAVESAFAMGIENLSADLMLGTPYQTKEHVMAAIDQLQTLPISHISCYMLKVEEGTPFYNSPLLKYCAKEDALAELYLAAVEALEKRGFAQYEISNFSKKGFESRHNLKYWRCEEYVGFGPAAHSYFDGKRYGYPPDLAAYLGGAEPAVTDSQPGGSDEVIMLGLRLCEGIDPGQLECTPKERDTLLKKAAAFTATGHMFTEGGRIGLTAKGFLLSNHIIGKLLYE